MKFISDNEHPIFVEQGNQSDDINVEKKIVT